VRDINKSKVAQVEKTDHMAETIFLEGYSHLLKLIGRENPTKWASIRENLRTLRTKNLQITVDEAR
jgi:hypothetical protein